MADGPLRAAGAKAADDLGTSAIVVAAAGLLCCPVIGQGAAIVLAMLARRQARRTGSAAGTRPQLAIGIAGLGLVGWLGIFVVAAAAGPSDVRTDPVAAGPRLERPASTTAAAETTTITATATTTVAAAPPPATTLSLSDSQLLAALRVAPEVDAGTYERDAFDYPGGGTDSRGCNTRGRVLQRDSTVPAQVDYPGCKVLAGRWVDATSGVAYEDPGQVSIDHLVPLKEADVSGAATWLAATKVAFGNDVDRVEALKVIGGSGNASKGDKDPAEWKPPLQAAWPSYARSWLVVKVAYGLTADQAEVDALRAMLAGPSAAPPAAAAAPAASPATTRPPATTSSGVYYVSCAAVRAAGKAPLTSDQPGYRPGLDGDADGVACE